MARSQAQEWEAAADAFRAALELHAASTIRYNLAAALVELGSYREASRELDRVLADEETPEAIRDLASALRDRVRAQAGRLRVEIAGDRAGAQVTLDGQALDEVWLSREIPVAPGPHALAVVRDGSALAEAEVALEAGATARVRLDVAPPGSSNEAAPAPLLEDWRFWLGVGGGTLALIVLVALVAAVAGSSGPSEAVPGNFMPGVITW